VTAINAALAAGKGIRRIVRELQAGVGTVLRLTFIRKRRQLCLFSLHFYGCGVFADLHEPQSLVKRLRWIDLQHS
jgi:hypothetical protein